MIRAIALLPLMLLASLGPSAAGRPAPTAGQKQAEAALAAFETAHPRCEVWSNWQKTCSRIGATVHCTVDRAKPVLPSAPFCMGQWEEAGEEARASRMRFCKKPDYFTLGGKRVPACARYREDRPFNGRRLRPLSSPACAEWREDVTNKKAGLYSTNGYYCARFNVKGCRDTSLRRAKQSALMPNGEGIIAGYEALPRLDSLPVHAISCGVNQ